MDHNVLMAKRASSDILGQRAHNMCEGDTRTICLGNNLTAVANCANCLQTFMVHDAWGTHVNSTDSVVHDAGGA